ncbi:hypothetical protein N0V90_000562 [Kalmusia sp. IMI 367209]|nr:hypothetical protein N0V90_000562 [Kalmusia sp. IMI 367209]
MSVIVEGRILEKSTLGDTRETTRGKHYIAEFQDAGHNEGSYVEPTVNRRQFAYQPYELHQPPRQPRLLFIAVGADLEIEDKEVLPYVRIKILGHGASASVEKVRDQLTGTSYARKTFRNIYARNLEEAKRNFRNEVRIMRRLATHHHIVKLHTTYLARRELALIVSPVADDGDLASFLQESRDHVYDRASLTTTMAPFVSYDDKLVAMNNTLKQAFGCLAAGLAFMHQQTIRHKDIKPQNILIHKGTVLYTDFGISLDFSNQGHSTTTGRPQSFTRKYCAPEVARHENRNSKSDIFSLGCVFAEITAALFLREISPFSLDGPFHEKIPNEGSAFIDQFNR